MATVKLNIKASDINEDFIKDNYISYDECLAHLGIKRSTLQDYIRKGKLFTQPFETIVCLDRKRRFHKEAVKGAVRYILEKNGLGQYLK